MCLVKLVIEEATHCGTIVMLELTWESTLCGTIAVLEPTWSKEQGPGQVPSEHM